MRPRPQEQGWESESDMSDGLGSGVVLGLRGEIAALRNVLSAMTMCAGRMTSESEGLPVLA